MGESETKTWRVGNKEVIAGLEYWLEQAKKGDFCYYALAAVKDGDQVAHDFAGAAGIEHHCIAGLKAATADLELVRAARRLGPRNIGLDASCHEWPFTGTPVNWDFLIWLVGAEMTRRRHNGPAPLRVHFSRTEFLDPYAKDFFECVFRPLLPLIGAIEDSAAAGGRHSPMYVPYDIVLASKAGEKVPILQASTEDRYTMDLWLHGERPITITLREAMHWEQRNSNLEAWLKFASDLEAQGNNVVFIRDTEKSTEPLPGFASCPAASHSVGMRMALYEQATCNLFVSNGPAGLGLFSKTPYLYFVNMKVDKKYRYPANHPLWWMRSNGLCEGEQWPWASPTQKMIWKTDDYENLCSAWEEYSPLLRAAWDQARYRLDNMYLQQNEHEFAWLLEQMNGAKSILEVGSCYGQALYNFAKAMPKGAKIRSIDLGRNDILHWPNAGDVLNSRVESLKNEGYDADVLFADSRSPEAINWAKGNAPYDLVFIDGDHTYEGVKADWEHYGSMGKIVAFHDIGNPHEAGVGKLWGELKSAYKTKENIRGWMGIGIVEK